MVKLLVSLVLGTMMAFGLPVVAWAQQTESSSRTSSFGDPLPGLTLSQLDQFDAGQEDFEEEETAADGLGPVFNDTSCAACHSNPTVGGDSNIFETRFGRLSDRKKFDPMTTFGGSLMQADGIGPVGACLGESAPREATIIAQRKTTPLLKFRYKRKA